MIILMLLPLIMTGYIGYQIIMMSPWLRYDTMISILIYLFTLQPMNSLFLHLLVTNGVINASNVIGEIFRYINRYSKIAYSISLYYRTTFTTLISLQYVWLFAPTDIKLGRCLIM